MASKAPGSGVDSEQSGCSTDLRKCHPHDHYQTYTVRRKKKKEGVNCINTPEINKYLTGEDMKIRGKPAQ